MYSVPSFSKVGKILLLYVLCLSDLVCAQEPTVKEVFEVSQVTQSMIENADSSINQGLTPLATIIALTKALQQNDWSSAIRFVDTRYLPEELEGYDRKLLLQQLVAVWQQNKIIDLSELSDEVDGDRSDGLPAYRELLGMIEIKNKHVPIYLQHVPDGAGGKMWKVSNATIARIPELWNEYGYPSALVELGGYLPQFRVIHMENWQFISLILIVIGAWILSKAFSLASLKLISYSRRYKDRLVRLFSVPLRWFLFVKIIQYGMGFLGLSLQARAYLNDSALGYLASLFLVLAVIEFVTALFLSNTKNTRYWAGIIRPVRTILKIIAMTVIALMWLADAGFNISTLLAGLGIGSLALALAAQKTLENVIGALTIYIAKPISPGDFCKLGQVSGTVEEIGLRSTSIRRLDRTLVHVPNASLMSMELENVSETDRRRFNKTIWLELETQPNKLRELIGSISEALTLHERVLDEALRVRFEEIERDGYRVAINAYINTAELSGYLEICEDINFKILDILEQCEINIARPTHRIVMNNERFVVGSP